MANALYNYTSSLSCKKEIQMNEKEFISYAKDKLGEILNKPGTILYSSHKTIRKSDIYLMGTNPGGTEGIDLRTNIDNLSNKETNAYLDEAWDSERTTYRKGEAPLQKRVQKILKGLGYNTREICATNLIFTQSKNLQALKYNFFDTANICWEVHEKLLSIVRPKIILVFGNSKQESPYSYLEHKYQISKGTTEEECGYSNWKFKSFKTEKYLVVGLPHLSYSINPERAINFINKQRKNAL